MKPQQLAAAKFLGIVLGGVLLLSWLRGLLRFVAFGLLLALAWVALQRLAKMLRAPVD